MRRCKKVTWLSKLILARNPVNISLHLRSAHICWQPWRLTHDEPTVQPRVGPDTGHLQPGHCHSWPGHDTQFDTVSVFLSSCLPSLYYQYNLQRSLLLKTFYQVTGASLGLTSTMITSKHQLCNHSAKPSGITALVLISGSFICNSRRNPAGGEVSPTKAGNERFLYQLEVSQIIFQMSTSPHCPASDQYQEDSSFLPSLMACRGVSLFILKWGFPSTAKNS